MAIVASGLPVAACVESASTYEAKRLKKPLTTVLLHMHQIKHMTVIRLSKN